MGARLLLAPGVCLFAARRRQRRRRPARASRLATRMMICADDKNGPARFDRARFGKNPGASLSRRIISPLAGRPVRNTSGLAGGLIAAHASTPSPRRGQIDYLYCYSTRRAASPSRALERVGAGPGLAQWPALSAVASLLAQLGRQRSRLRPPSAQLDERARKC